VVADARPDGSRHQGARVEPRKSAKTGSGQLDVPVVFGGVTFEPGAHLWSDEDGLLVMEQRVYD